MDLKKFRQSNKLTQTELGDYLGIKKSFISLVENNRAKLPDDKFNKLLNNPHGWDVSMLTEERGSIIAGNNNGGDVNVQIGRNRSGEVGSSVREAVLEKENEMLRERLKDKDEQIELLKSLIQGNK